MRILWLYRFIPSYNFDHFLHMDVAECMNGLEGIELKCYGPDLHISNPKICLQPYNPSTTLEQIYNMFPFDTIVICTKSRMFFNYLPWFAMGNTRGEIVEGEWLPKDFTSFSKGKRVVFEEDYHYEKDNAWYRDRGISAVLQRHYCNVPFGNSNGQGVKHIFFPFSIDPKTFYDRGKLRNNAIRYVGSLNSQYYIDRTKAIEVLSRHNLIQSDRLVDESYTDSLNQFTCHLSGQSTYHILPAKIYEIAACGSVLFTNASEKSGIARVFSPDSYVAWKDDFSDIVDKARMILNDREMQKAIVHKAKLEIMMRHTHYIRTKEFLEIMKNV